MQPPGGDATPVAPVGDANGTVETQVVSSGTLEKVRSGGWGGGRGALASSFREVVRTGVCHAHEDVISIGRVC